MRLGLIVVVALVAVTGCKSVPKYMKQIDGDRPLVAPPDKALIVFVRSAKLGFAIRAHIMDDQANFLGTAIAGGHFGVTRAPGPQKFIVWSEVTDVLVADLAPGLVYFAEIIPRMGLMRARFSFKAAHRGTDLFPYPKDDLESTTRYQVDAARAREEMDDAEERREKLKDAKGELTGMSPNELAQHTLVPSDGHLEAGTPGNAAVAMAANVPPPPPPPPGAAPQAVATPAAGAAPGQARFGKGALVRVKLKTGVLWIGEVVTETSQGLLLSVGGTTQMFPFANMESVDALSAAK